MDQPTPRDHDGVWVPCGTCWGQRRLYVAPADGGRLAARTCPSCMGLGERLSGGDQVPAPTG